MCKSCVEAIFADVVRKEIKDGNVRKVEHSVGPQKFNTCLIRWPISRKKKVTMKSKIYKGATTQKRCDSSTSSFFIYFQLD